MIHIYKIEVSIVIRGFMCSIYDETNQTKFGRMQLSTAIEKFPEIIHMNEGCKHYAKLETDKLNHTRFDKYA
ncbi:hypothetical protein K4Q22_00925 [Staphylococcus epidermidis]|nr:hypothetical protein [Staphylococcus epidermidis]